VDKYCSVVLTIGVGRWRMGEEVQKGGGHRQSGATPDMVFVRHNPSDNVCNPSILPVAASIM
jgi:hypothetical protein